MKLTKIISLLIGISLVIWYLGCAKTVTVMNHENFWWIEGNTRVKLKGNERWIEVVKVESDSIYGHYLNPKSDSLVVIHLDSIERVEKVIPNDFVSLLYGILIGSIVGSVLVLLIAISS